jgi:hypothetical protein
MMTRENLEFYEMTDEELIGCYWFSDMLPEKDIEELIEEINKRNLQILDK